MARAVNASTPQTADPKVFQEERDWLRSFGKSDVQIAEQWGLAWATFQVYCRRHNLPPAVNPAHVEYLEAVALNNALRAGGHSGPGGYTRRAP